MNQYKKGYEIRNAAKDALEGKYGGAVRIFLLNALISGVARLLISNIGSSTVNSVYAMTSSQGAATAMNRIFDVLLLLANIVLGVMNAGITLYFLKIACNQPVSVKDLFYGFKTDSKKLLVISAVLELCRTLCLGPGQYLSQNYLTSRDGRWLIYALIAMAAGLCVYIPVLLGISLSFYLALDFPQNTGKEILMLCWRRMKGHRGRLFAMELSFLPLIFLCILSFGIGFLWLYPYMQMVYTCFFLDLMNPKKAS